MGEKIQKIKSTVNDFLFEKRSFVVLIIFTALTVFITYILYSYTQNLLKERLQQRIVAIVATGALQFDHSDIEKIVDSGSMKLPEFEKIINTLVQIRSANQNVKFAYVMRRTKDPNMFSFVADADQLNPTAPGADDPPLPGDIYDATNYPVLREEAFDHPSVDRELQADKWGLLLSSYAPIRDKNGNAIAILGLDVRVDDFNQQTRATLLPFALFIAFLVLLLVLLTLLLIRFWGEKVEAVKELDRQKDAVLHMVAHQLKGPVTTINFTTELLLDGTYGQLNPEQKNNITTIRTASQKMGSQSEMVLDAAKITSGKLPLHLESLDLNELFKEVVEEAKNHAKEKSVHLNVSLPTASLPTVILDRKYTQLAIDNLLSNAIKYTALKSEGGSANFTVEIKDKNLLCTVKDTGIGIPKNEHENIFKELYRASNAGKDGNGLGLHVTKGAIEAQGGKIWFESVEGKGTTFYVQLPLVYPDKK